MQTKAPPPLYDSEGALMTRTKELVNESGLTLPEIYTVTGISFYWLKKFMSGEISNPSVNRVQFLYEFLTNKKINL